MIDRVFTRKDGTERVLPLAAIAKFADGFGGNLIWAGHRQDNEARQVWNGMVDKRPAVVAQCCRSSDALACIRFARQHELLVSVKRGRTQLRWELRLQRGNGHRFFADADGCG